jgi:hypothetical protein
MIDSQDRPDCLVCHGARTFLLMGYDWDLLSKAIDITVRVRGFMCSELLSVKATALSAI